MNENILKINTKFKTILTKENSILFFISFLFFLLIFISNGIAGGYGYYIDEFYYIACANHLDFGYVDHPPFSIFILYIIKFLFGTSIITIRFLPALVSAITIFITAKITKKLGGNLFSQITASLFFALTPVFLVNSGFYSMNSIEVLLWVIIIYLILVIINDDKPVLWLAVGILLGIGLENKHTIIFFAFAIIVSILLTSNRKYFKNKWLWLSIFSAFIIFIPNLIWQVNHNWMSLEFYTNASMNKYANVPPHKAFLNLILTFNPILFPFWMMGLYYIMIDREGRKNNFIFGIIFIILLIITLFAASSRPDRITGIFPLLFASGIVFLEKITNRISLQWLKKTIYTIIILDVLISIVIFIPVSVPILPPDKLSGYGAILKIVPKQEKNNISELPQWFSNRFGWDDLVEGVAKVYDKLSEEDKKQIVILTGNYGYSGSIDLLGKKYNLPNTISNFNNYYLWGYKNNSCNKIMVIGDIWPQTIKTYYKNVEKIGKVYCGEYSMEWRRNVPIYLASDPFDKIENIWPKIKFFF